MPKCKTCNSEMKPHYSREGGVIWICPNFQLTVDYSKKPMPHGLIYCVPQTDKKASE